MKRYLTTLYRGRWLYLLVVLLPLGASFAGAFYLARPTYEASARVWVDRPALASLLDQPAQATYPPPPTLAEQQAERLRQLLQSDAFVVGIVRETAAARELTGDPRGDARVLADIRQRLVVSAAGANTVTIRFTAADRELSRQLVEVVLEQFRAWTVRDQVAERTTLAQEYRRQLEAQEAQVAELRRAIADAQRRFPATADGATPQYIELERLNRELEAAQGRQTTLRTRIEQAGLSGGVDNEGWLQQFRILDPPTALPQGTFATLLGRLTYLALGLGTGVALVAAAVAFATWRDATVHTPDELAALAALPLVGVIPHLSPGGRGRENAEALPARREEERSREIAARGLAE